VKHTGYEAPHYAVISGLLPLPLMSKYSFQHPVLIYPECSVRDQVSHPYRTTGEIILISKFSERKWELNGMKHSPNLVYSLIYS